MLLEKGRLEKMIIAGEFIAADRPLALLRTFELNTAWEHTDYFRSNDTWTVKHPVQEGIHRGSSPPLYHLCRPSDKSVTRAVRSKGILSNQQDETAIMLYGFKRSTERPCASWKYISACNLFANATAMSRDSLLIFQ